MNRIRHEIYETGYGMFEEVSDTLEMLSTANGRGRIAARMMIDEALALVVSAGITGGILARRYIVEQVRKHPETAKAAAVGVGFGVVIYGGYCIYNRSLEENKEI